MRYLNSIQGGYSEISEIPDRQYDFLIVGTGLFGATFAHEAIKKGLSCLVIDRRDVIGGNLYCKVIDNIPVHAYGAHIFHTSNKKVWEFVNHIVPFNRYTNAPIANYKGELYNLPFNMNTFNRLWGCITPAEALAQLDKQRAEALARMESEGRTVPNNLEEQALTLVGKDIYEKLIKGYTEKQWGRSCSELPSFIIRRLPVRLVYDNNYFNDLYQGIPESEDGYNTLIAQLLKGTDTVVGLNYFSKSLGEWQDIAKHIVYTGPIDEFFNYRYGPLSYRSVRFENEVLSQPNYQGNAVVNYTDRETPFTRIIEHKHFCKFGNAVYDHPNTVISKEYSTEWEPGIEPFYPVNDSDNEALYEKYKTLADGIPNVSFGGRLGTYKYFDMDKTIEAAWDLSTKLL